jgi:hypothetical protein
MQKCIAREFFEFVKIGRLNNITRFFASYCKTHNPYVLGSMNILINTMELANKSFAPMDPRAEFVVKHILNDGDLVPVHTQLVSDCSNLSKGGLSQTQLVVDLSTHVFLNCVECRPDMCMAGISRRRKKEGAKLKYARLTEVMAIEIILT